MHIDEEGNSRYTKEVYLAGIRFKEGKHKSSQFVQCSRYNNEQIATKINQQSTQFAYSHGLVFRTGRGTKVTLHLQTRVCLSFDVEASP